MALLKHLIEEDSENNIIECASLCLEKYWEKLDDSDEHVFRSVEFLLEQLRLICKHKNARRYSAELIVFCYSIYAASASAYKTVISQEILCFPSVRLLIKLTRNIDSNEGICSDKYLTMRSSKLKDFQKHVVLIIDEIYVSSRVEYSAGKIIGQNAGASISTVLCFMIKSLADKYRDVVGLFPVSRNCASTQISCFHSVLKHVTSIGFNVVCVSTDNHTINRSFFRNLCGGEITTAIPHPLQEDAYIFLVLDPTHCLKNIFNNFERRKYFSWPIHPPISENSGNASFYHLSDLCEIESSMAIRMAHKLNYRMLNPSAIEKSSLKFACSVFHESTRNALIYYAEHQNMPQLLDTAHFIGMINKLWNILNVRTTAIGK